MSEAIVNLPTNDNPYLPILVAQHEKLTHRLHQIEQQLAELTVDHLLTLAARLQAQSTLDTLSVGDSHENA